MIKHLTLLRHADAEPVYQDGGEDSFRRLSETGLKQCEALAQHLADTKFDLVLCSPARRTLDTAAQALAGRYAKLIAGDTLYNAGAPELIERIARVDETVSSLLVIAHNPGISKCAEMLASDARQPPRHMSPGMLVSFIMAGAWNDIAQGSLQLSEVFTP